MFNRGQAIVHLSISVTAAFIYSAIYFNQLFSNCPTISCIAGSNGYFEYIWLNVLCLISGMQIWKYGLKPYHHLWNAPSNVSRIFRIACLGAACMGVIGLGIFASAHNNHDQPTVTSFVAPSTSDSDQLVSTGALECFSLDCHAVDPNTGQCDVLHCVVYDQLVQQGLHLPYGECSSYKYEECACSQFSDFQPGACLVYNCTAQTTNATGRCDDPAFDPMADKGAASSDLHTICALFFFVFGMLVLAHRTWKFEVGCPRLSQTGYGEAARFFIALACGIGLVVFNGISTMHMPYYCLQDSNGVCTNVDMSVRLVNFFGALCEAAFVLTIYSCAFPDHKMKDQPTQICESKDSKQTEELATIVTNTK